MFSNIYKFGHANTIKYLPKSVKFLQVESDCWLSN